jgi:hypothetical protein
MAELDHTDSDGPESPDKPFNLIDGAVGPSLKRPGNPTGTQNDRIAFAQAMEALYRGFDTIAVVACVSLWQTIVIWRCRQGGKYDSNARRKRHCIL